MPGDEVAPVRQQVVQDHDPVVVGADGELVLGQDHPLGGDAAQLRGPERRPVGHDGAGSRDRDRLAGRDVRRTADDRRGVPLPHGHVADGQAVGVRVALGGEDAPDDEEVERRDAVVVDPVDDGPGQVEPVGQLPRSTAPGA